jgi:hypothetical protein
LEFGFAVDAGAGSVSGTFAGLVAAVHSSSGVIATGSSSFGPGVGHPVAGRGVGVGTWRQSGDGVEAGDFTDDGVEVEDSLVVLGVGSRDLGSLAEEDEIESAERSFDGIDAGVSDGLPSGTLSFSLFRNRALIVVESRLSTEVGEEGRVVVEVSFGTELGDDVFEEIVFGLGGIPLNILLCCHGS